MLQVVPLSWPLMVKAFQTFYISKALFGGFGKWPTHNTTNKLLGRLTAALASSHRAARQLRKLSYGAITCLGMVVCNAGCGPGGGRRRVPTSIC